MPLELALPEVEAAQDPDVVVPAESLEQIGLAARDGVACIPVAWQIAQKLHACTDPGPDGGGNEQPRDLVDLALLRELVDDWSQVRRACVRIFEHRARHPWPPAVWSWPSWPALWDRLAEDGETVVTLREAVMATEELIARIDAAGSD